MAEPAMREQIARAICRKHWPDEQFWQGYLPDVDAILASMERPTKAMLEAGWAPAHNEDAAGVWEEMIRAAREGK